MRKTTLIIVVLALLLAALACAPATQTGPGPTMDSIPKAGSRNSSDADICFILSGVSFVRRVS